MTQGEMFSDLALEQQYDNMIKALDMKQTAVDWLFNRLWEIPKDKLIWNSLLKEAKQREKMQIERANLHGASATILHKFELEKYYKETYEKDGDI